MPPRHACQNSLPLPPANKKKKFFSSPPGTSHCHCLRSAVARHHCLPSFFISPVNFLFSPGRKRERGRVSLSLRLPVGNYFLGPSPAWGIFFLQ